MAKFSGYILICDLILLILAGIPVLYFSGYHLFVSGLTGLILTSVFAILSYIPFTRMSASSMNRYMAAMLAGMMVRMVCIGISVAVVFLFTDLHQIGFTVALLFSYIYKSVVETYLLTRKQRGHSSAA
jgi:hypothetical protein